MLIFQLMINFTAFSSNLETSSFGIDISKEENEILDSKCEMRNAYVMVAIVIQFYKASYSLV